MISIKPLSLRTVFCYLAITTCAAAESAAKPEALVAELNDAATSLYQQGRYEDAIDTWQQALEHLNLQARLSASSPEQQPLLSDVELKVAIQRRLAYAGKALGLDEWAYQLLREALTTLRESGVMPSFSIEESLLLGQLGEMALGDGRWQDAGEYLSDSVNQARALEHPPTLAWSLNNLANALVLAAYYDEAFEAYTEGLELATTVGDKGLQNTLRINLIRLHLQLLQSDFTRHWQLAYDRLQEAAEELHQRYPDYSDTVRQTADLITLALLSEKLQQHSASAQTEIRQASYVRERRLETLRENLLQRALQQAEILGSAHHQAYAHGYLGQLAETRQNYSQALQQTQNALLLAQQTGDPANLYLWQWQLGRIYRAQGKMADAVKAYRQAVATLNPVRGDLMNNYRAGSSVFRERIQPVYFGLADLLLTQAQQVGQSGSGASDGEGYGENYGESSGDGDELNEEAVRLTEAIYEDELRLLNEARDTVEVLKTAELQDYFQDECTVALQDKRTVLDNVDPRSAVIYPVILPQRLVLLLSVDDRLRQVVVPVDGPTLEETSRRFRRHLQIRSLNNYLRESRQLYDWLIRPLEPYLADRDIDTLVFVPDGALRTIPFGTLQDGQRFLIERYAVAMTPSVSLTDPQPFAGVGKLSSEETEVLIIGLSKAVQGFSPLPSVPSELRTVQSLIGGKILEDGEYSLESLSNALTTTEYGIVHMATHGVFGGSDENSFLLTHDEQVNMSQLGELLRMGIFREDPLELLTLSACQTALGNDRAALGLAGVAVQSGARSVSATLWFVDDASTAAVMKGFYRYLASNEVTKARALQLAQLDLMEKARYRHPIYWGPYLLIGNWL